MKMDLKCKKLDCKNNNRYACMKDSIQVAQDSTCDSYEMVEEIAKQNIQDASKNMFEAAPDYHPYRHKKDVNIECGADCLFNNWGRCKANGISVCSIVNDALCTTFIKK